MSTTFAEIYQTLSAIDCTPLVEKKGKLTYLSWARAWQVLMNTYPQASFEYGNERTIGDTVEVNCLVNIDGNLRRMHLPVMDHRNQAICQPNARDINDARMRCLVKCLALFGLGLYIYAGEDIPRAPTASPEPADGALTAEQYKSLADLLEAAQADIPAFCKAFNVAEFNQLPQSQYERAVAALNRKIQKQQAAQVADNDQ